MLNSTFDLPAFLLSKLYDNMDWENGWTLADAIALAEDVRRYDGIDCDPQAETHSGSSAGRVAGNPREPCS